MKNKRRKSIKHQWLAKAATWRNKHKQYISEKAKA